MLAGLFPDDALLPLDEEIFIDEKPDYHAFTGEAEKLTGAEVMATFNVGAAPPSRQRLQRPAARRARITRKVNGA